MLGAHRKSQEVYGELRMPARNWCVCGALWLLWHGCALAGEEACKPGQLGAEVATQVCSTCHAVAKDQKIAPVLKEHTPSFFEIAARPDTTAQSLRGFLERTHWDRSTFPMAMPRLTLTPEEVDAVTCYILSLRPRH